MWKGGARDFEIRKYLESVEVACFEWLLCYVWGMLDKCRGVGLEILRLGSMKRVLGVAFMVGVKWSLEELESGLRV